ASATTAQPMYVPLLDTAGPRLAEQPRRIDEKHDEDDEIRKDVHEGGRDIAATQLFADAEQDAAEDRATQMAEAAERHRRERLEQGRRAHVRIEQCHRGDE